MGLVRVAGACASQACPTVYLTEGGDVAVQGAHLLDPGIDGGVPSGEAVVTVPMTLILEAAEKLARPA